MTMQVDATLRDELAAALRDVEALRALANERRDRVNRLVAELVAHQDALRDIAANALSGHRPARLRPETLHLIHSACRPAYPPAAPYAHQRREE